MLVIIQVTASKEFDVKLEQRFDAKSRKPDIEIVGMCSFGSDHTDSEELVNLATRRATPNVFLVASDCVPTLVKQYVSYPVSQKFPRLP